MYNIKVLDWDDIQDFIMEVSDHFDDKDITHISVVFDTGQNMGMTGESKFSIFVDEPSDMITEDDIRHRLVGQYLHLYVEDLVQHMMSKGVLEMDTYLVYYSW